MTFRFEKSELGSTWAEICAYGTAVRARPAEPGQPAAIVAVIAGEPASVWKTTQ